MGIVRTGNLKGNKRASRETQILQALFKPILSYDTSMTERDTLPRTSSREPSMAANNPICITKNSALSLYPLLKDKAPTYLLLEGLIHERCERLEPDPDKCKQLFESTCERLERFGFLGTSWQLKALDPSRQFLGSKFDLLVLEIKNRDSGCRALPPTQNQKINVKQHRLLHSDAPFNVPIEPNRWQHEFFDKKMIEKGGFGVVYKAKHHLDDVYYAIKEITFRFRTTEDFKKIVREVQLYANLPSHPYVVSYKTAWIDYKFVELKQTTFRNKRCSESDKEELLKVPTLRIFDLDNVSEEGSSIQFREVSKEVEKDVKVIGGFDADQKAKTTAGIYPNGKRRRRHSLETLPLDLADLALSDSAVDYGIHKPGIKIDGLTDEEDESVNKRGNKCQFRALLYIQMELCGQNLKKWIRDRNEKFFQNHNDLEHSLLLDTDMYKYSLNLFKQILKGVEFLHEYHLIHRDLKPQNIFFTITGEKVKIGDFGLATLHEDDVMVEHSPVRWDSKFPSGSIGFDHSKGMGTMVYIAPEQKNSTKYDVKADMFSLGIILWELMQPFKTRMEKGKTLDDLKNRGVLPQNFVEKFPEAAAVIINLTSDPQNRPSAREVLRSPLCKSKEQLIREQQEEIERLRQELKERDQEVRNRDQELRNRNQKIVVLESALHLLFNE